MEGCERFQEPARLGQRGFGDSQSVCRSGFSWSAFQAGGLRDDRSKLEPQVIEEHLLQVPRVLVRPFACLGLFGVKEFREKGEPTSGCRQTSSGSSNE